MRRRSQHRARAFALVWAVWLLVGLAACEPSVDPDARCVNRHAGIAHPPPCSAGELLGHFDGDRFVAVAPPSLRVRWIDEPGGGIVVLLAVLGLPLLTGMGATRGLARAPDDEALFVILAGAGILGALALVFAVELIVSTGVGASAGDAIGFAALYFVLMLPATLFGWFGIVQCRGRRERGGVGIAALAVSAVCFVAALWFVARPFTHGPL
jgi:hypothetical protein